MDLSSFYFKLLSVIFITIHLFLSALVSDIVEKCFFLDFFIILIQALIQLAGWSSFILHQIQMSDFTNSSILSTFISFFVLRSKVNLMSSNFTS
jgi:hypothetical protein